MNVKKIALFLCAAAGASSASASVSLVTTRSGLPMNDFIDWGQFGGSGQTVPNPSNGTTNGGLGYSIQKPGGDFQRLDAGIGWGGGFAEGDRLIFAIGDDSMTVEFDTPVVGAGMQIWRNYPGANIAVQIDAYDTGGGLLGSFSGAPTGGGGAPNNNQAGFVGVLSDRADIKRVVYTVSGEGANQEFSGNQMDVVTGNPCYSDCDTTTGVGVLDIFDFLCFQNRFEAGAPYACDCDTSTGPGVCDVFDFLCFQNDFAAGCP
jgi:hypothetical protein